MKICGIVCEYNPFHNGHAYQLQEAKKRSGADAVVCVMGGNFTQRGEAALLPDTLRAKHAVQCGADAVIALPAVFSSAPAEIFARGAIKILSAAPGFSCLSFGAEHADADFYAAAAVLNDENAYFYKVKNLLSNGASFAAARSEALKDSPVFALLNSPNDVLGIEYARALSRAFCREQTGTEQEAEQGTERAARNVTLFPVARKGDYKAHGLTGGFSSAAAIRQAVKDGGLSAAKNALPPAVYNDIQRFFQREESAKNAETALQIAEKTAI
ncbi:MAG: nucleotidyltransferase family protein, partial [Candidatus Scatosoma sp.]